MISPLPFISQFELLFYPGHDSKCQTLTIARPVFWINYTQVVLGGHDTSGSAFPMVS